MLFSSSIFCPRRNPQVTSRPGLWIPEITLTRPLPLPLLRERGGEGALGGVRGGDGVLGGKRGGEGVPGGDLAGDEGGVEKGEGILKMEVVLDRVLDLSNGSSGESGPLPRGLVPLIGGSFAA